MRAHGGNKAAASAAATAAAITATASAAAITATASAALLTIITVRLPRVRHVVALRAVDNFFLGQRLRVDLIQDLLGPCLTLRVLLFF